MATADGSDVDRAPKKAPEKIPQANIVKKHQNTAKIASPTIKAKILTNVSCRFILITLSFANLAHYTSRYRSLE